MFYLLQGTTGLKVLFMQCPCPPCRAIAGLGRAQTMCTESLVVPLIGVIRSLLVGTFARIEVGQGVFLPAANAFSAVRPCLEEAGGTR